MSAFERISSFARRRAAVIVLFGALLAPACVHKPTPPTTTSTSTSTTTSTVPGPEAWDAWYLDLRPNEERYPELAGIRPYVTFDLARAFLGCNEFRLIRLSDAAFPVRVEAAGTEDRSSQCSKEVLDFETSFIGTLVQVGSYGIFGDELLLSATDFCLCGPFFRYRRVPVSEVETALTRDTWSVSAVRNSTGQLAALPSSREVLITFRSSGGVALEGVNVPFMGRHSGIKWTMTGERMLTRLEGWAWDDGCVDQDWIDRNVAPNPTPGAWHVDFHGLCTVMALNAARSVHIDRDVLTLSSDTGDAVLTARRRGTQ
jgi:hypothetical protein